MGKKALRASKGKGGQSWKDDLILVKSDSYSDDYHIAPDFLLQEHQQVAPPPPPYCNGGVANCCSRRKVACPKGDYCCSRDTCLSPERRYYRNSSSVSPVRRPPVYDASPRRRHKMDVPSMILNERCANVVRRAPSSFCSSCESCDSCASGGSSSYALAAPFFASPIHSTQASFYRANLSPQHSFSPDRYPPHKWGSPAGQRMRRSPNRMGGSCAADLGCHPGERFSRRKKGNPEGARGRKNARRAKSFNEVNTLYEEIGGGKSPECLSREKVRVVTAGNRNKSAEEDKQIHQRNKNQNDRPVRTQAPPSRSSPTRSDGRTCDSGVGKSYRTTSGSSGNEGSRSDERRRDRAREDRGGRRERKEDDKQESTTNLKQNNLLNKMVNQTREHRKQIKTLESELERLRSSGDMLSSCEVNQRDVEWRPGDVVGEGSFSTVYKGSYCGTEVAVKELKFKLSQDDKNYFRSEAALLQQLHHPRVVLLMGVCTSSARPFMLLEYLSGGTLHSLIHSTTRERVDHAAYFSIAKDVAQGLNYLHKHDPQVLHLDLKSMNVLLDSYTRAKIADFGFSILRRARGGGSAVQRGSIRGTPAWMAPELLTKGEVSPKCDVYSYAIILWEMLTASFPFQGLDIFHIMEAVEDGNRPPLPQTGVSRELRELIISCWAQNPSLRPSFEEILGALETASLPASWKKVLSKANIGPSALSDVTAARAIISMIERSVELLERSHRDYRRSRSDETETEMAEEKENVRYRNVRKAPVHDSLSIEPTSRGRVLSPKANKARPVSISREDRFEVDNRVTKSSHLERHDRRSPAKKCSSPRRDKKAACNGRLFSPNGKYVTDDDRSKYLDNKKRQIKEQRTGKSHSPQKTEVKHRESRSYSRSPSKGRLYRNKDQRCENRGKVYNNNNNNNNISCSSNRSKILEEGFTTEGTHYSDERNNPRQHKRRSRASSEEERNVQPRETEHSNNSDELDSCISSRKSYIKPSHGSSSPKKSISPSRKPPTRSPTLSPTRKSRVKSPQKRRSPVRRSYSPEKVASDLRHEPALVPKYGGIMLTAEQLLDQKQRLRPVRPSGLKDLSSLPQSSLNDISLILKQAMIQRRVSVEQMHSARETGPSKDIGWSDWY